MWPEPHNLKRFVCVVDDRANDQDELDEQGSEKPRDKDKELVDVTLTTKDNEPKPIFMSANLSVELKQVILSLIWEFKDVVAWNYAELSGLDLQLVSHKLNRKEGN